jgi:SAM-dependent methyltransferase
VSLHADRGRAESFGTVAELYDRVRPSYPPALVDALVEGGVRDVLDVGAGPGIAGALLAARGCAVLGVEVDERMAARARAKGLAVEVAPFERWEPLRRSFDLVISAQAWHWVEPGAGARRAARLLRAQGRLAVFWNLGDPPAPMRAALDPVYDRLEPALEHGTRRGGAARQGAPESAVEGIAASGSFEPSTIRRFPWRRSYDAEGWVALLATHSDHQTLPPARREALLEAIATTVRELGDSFEMLYETVLVDARVARERPSTN